MAKIYYPDFNKPPDNNNFESILLTVTSLAETIVNNNYYSFCDDHHYPTNCNASCEQKCYISCSLTDSDWLVVKYNTSLGTQYRVERGITEPEGETYILINNKEQMINYIYRNDKDISKEVFESIDNETILSDRVNTLLLILNNAEAISLNQASINQNSKRAGKLSKNPHHLRVLNLADIDK